MDNGHYHPTEYVSDKIPAMLCFYPEFALHITRGFRSWQKALLTALCTPNEMLKELQDTNQLGKLMVMHEAVKMLPIGEIWEEYCRREGVCDDLHFYDEIERYEREVLTKRG